eukprot:jgi/Botrbrau1/21588/Bobra.0492s0001.1
MCRRYWPMWKALAKEVKKQPKSFRTLVDLNLPQVCREVIDKDADAVLDEVEAAIYAKWRPFASRSTCRKAVITPASSSWCTSCASSASTSRKRDLFYTDVKLFEEQGNSDSVLDDVACMLGCTRSSLHGPPPLLSSLTSSALNPEVVFPA